MNPDFALGRGSRVELGRSADFAIGGLRVTPARRQIRFEDETRILEPRVMQVLVALVEAMPGVLSRDQLAEICWGGLNVGDDAINRCIVALRRLAREFEPQPYTIETIPRVGYCIREGVWRRTMLGGSLGAAGALKGGMLLAALIAGTLLVIGLVTWQRWQQAAVSVAAIPAVATPESDQFARDLTAKLGMLTPVMKHPVRLFEGVEAEHADLLFQIDASPTRQDLETNLVLLNKRREVLWAKNFQRHHTELSNLNQQIAFSAGTVLQCAVEGLRDRPTISRDTLKTYLNACADYGESSEETTRQLREALARVTIGAHLFEPAWKRLLVIDSEIVSDFNFQSADVVASDRRHLEADIFAARSVDAHMPELLIAEAALRPVSDFSQRLRLTEEALARSPDDPRLLLFHSRILSQVGRLRDSVEDMRRAARADPLSPATREGLVFTLASAGNLAEAKEELLESEQLWPGAASLLEARYFLYLRFDDPREAMRLRNSGVLVVSGAPWHGAFLEARADPTPANVEKAIRNSRSYFAHMPLAIADFAQALVTFGREDELFEVLLDARERYDVDDLLEVIFRPAFRKFHHDPRMMQVAARFGLLHYWQGSGKWPDFCFDPELPYDCRVEGAKLLRHR